MELKLVRNILKMYGLSAVNIQGPLSGYRNKCYKIETKDVEPKNLIIYKREQDILSKIYASHKVSVLLKSEKFPVRYPAVDRVVKLSGKNQIRYACLYNYLPGETIAWEAYEKRHIKLLGKTLSDMHHALKGSDINGLPLVTEECRYIIRRMEKYFSQEGVKSALRTKLGLKITLDFNEFIKTLNDTEKLSGQQPLHMDFVRSNILFSTPENSKEYEISGILDFEKASLGHPVFDTARTLAFLLVDCKYKTPREVRKYFIDSGYNKRGNSTLSLELKPILEKLVDLYLYYDFYKFLKHNPYEYLKQNEHFERTKAYLKKRGFCNEFIQQQHNPLKSVKIYK